MISSLELAKLCGVSQGTVDRALHGRGGIAAATRERVLAAARLHGYAPNPAARELMTGRSKVCGAVIPAGPGIFFMDLFDELRKALKRRGLSLLFSYASDAGETSAALVEMASRRLRALALVPPSDSYKAPFQGHIVSLASPCEGALYIAPDETATGFRGAEWLWSLGHRRIALVTYSRDARAIRDRRTGYERFMKSQGASPLVLVTPSDRELVEAGADALFCHNDWLALNCLRTLERAGLRVPAEVSVLGVDDSPTFNALFPGLSTMSYPYAEVAEAAAAAMLEEASRPAIPPLAIRSRNTTAPKTP